MVVTVPNTLQPAAKAHGGECPGVNIYFVTDVALQHVVPTAEI